MGTVSGILTSVACEVKRRKAEMCKAFKIRLECAHAQQTTYRSLFEGGGFWYELPEQPGLLKKMCSCVVRDSYGDNFRNCATEIRT